MQAIKKLNKHLNHPNMMTEYSISVFVHHSTTLSTTLFLTCHTAVYTSALLFTLHLTRPGRFLVYHGSLSGLPDGRNQSTVAPGMSSGFVDYFHSISGWLVSVGGYCFWTLTDAHRQNEIWTASAAQSGARMSFLLYQLQGLEEADQGSPSCRQARHGG